MSSEDFNIEKVDIDDLLGWLETEICRRHYDPEDKIGAAPFSTYEIRQEIRRRLND